MTYDIILIVNDVEQVVGVELDPHDSLIWEFDLDKFRMQYQVVGGNGARIAIVKKI